MYMGVYMKKKKNKNSKFMKFKLMIKDEHRFNIMLMVAFFIGVLFIFCTYAWFYASLNVRVEFFNMVVTNNSGLFVSLDGIDYGSSVEISRDSLFNNLNDKYPNHTNQWASRGLFGVSTNGLSSPTNSKFDVYTATEISYRGEGNRKRYITTELSSEDKPNTANVYVAFDLFLKNVSGSPYTDNLYLADGTSIYFEDEETDSYADGSLNSMRIGIVKMGSTSSKSDINTIQNLTCDDTCEMLIFEPNNTSHSDESIERAKKYGITIKKGEAMPTYAVIKERENLIFESGHEGTGYPLDTEHLKLQETITSTSMEDPIFEIPNGVTKVRIYVWIEAQDVDSLETRPKGAEIAIVINFFKDLAGYYKG